MALQNLKPMKGHLILLKNPLAAHHLSTMRNRDTPSSEFSRSLRRLGYFLGYQVASSFRTEPIEVTTPFGRSASRKLSERIVVLGVFRDAFPIIEALRDLLPDANYGFVFTSRGPPPEYAVTLSDPRIPEVGTDDRLIIVDPVISTGSTMVRLIRDYIMRGRSRPKSIDILSIVVTRGGVENISRSFQGGAEISVWALAIDPGLNKWGFVRPGLGDVGDRVYNTQLDFPLRA